MTQQEFIATVLGKLVNIEGLINHAQNCDPQNREYLSYAMLHVQNAIDSMQHFQTALKNGSKQIPEPLKEILNFYFPPDSGHTNP